MRQTITFLVCLVMVLAGCDGEQGSSPDPLRTGRSVQALAAASPAEEYQPSGPRRYYKASVDSSRIAAGGPLRNYHDGTIWRAVNPDFYSQSNWLVSDSGYHAVGVNLTTNTVWLNWRGHYLGLNVAPLYVLRLSTLERTKIADPNFSNRSYADNLITITDIYPDVDLEIRNSPDGIRHLFRFHQAARTQIETWWQNNGQHDDIWIINTFRLNVDSLNAIWSDRNGSFPVNQPRVIKLPAQITGAETPLFVIGSQVELESAEYDRRDTLHHRLLLVGSNVYLAEGFRWAAVREWEDGTINHCAVFGNQNNSDGNGPFDEAQGISDPTYQYTAATGDVVDSLYAYMKSYSSPMQLDVGVYDVDGSDIPDNRLGYIRIVAPSKNEGAYGEDVNLSMANGTTYTVCAANGTGATRLFYNTETLGDGSRQTDNNLNATWVQNIASVSVMRIWAVYTTGGDGPTLTGRRRRSHDRLRNN